MNKDILIENDLIKIMDKVDDKMSNVYKCLLYLIVKYHYLSENDIN